MQALLITLKGGEDIAAMDVKEIIGREAKILEGAVQFEATYEDLFKLAYLSQSALRILCLEKPEVWLEKGMTFAVRSGKKEEEMSFGEKIHNKGFAVNLSDPDVPFHVYNGLLGIDFTGDMHTRSFRVFTHKHTLNGVTAYILLRKAGFDGTQKLVDPFSKDGTIILEAAHHALHKSVRFFDREFPFMDFAKFKDVDFEALFNRLRENTRKPQLTAVSNDFRDINSIRKNMKVAGVEVQLSRQNIDWLDLKFRDKGVDLLVSYPPHLPGKLWDEFLKVAQKIAKKTVLLVDKDFQDDAMTKEEFLHIGKDTKKIAYFE
tara:strand:+ start:461 stop:1414 length:954 start_codon:yes stop_codon:yes gene_type:complete